MSFENVKKLSAYEVISEERLKDLKSDGCILRHKKTGARICLIANDDDNKVFYIGFRTPAKDSTGVQHIMEHSVLCGSKKYPAKDPFVELAKGSLNTFLNAMTYPDKTVYPVASCNDKDFKNLMDVYLDAVFNPNVYIRPQIFKQEGWHYELKDKDDPITINGVVYNEMKGAFSSPDDTLDREIIRSLFPDTGYFNESGGDPDIIPELTYEDFLRLHSEYYHPSNSYIYLYGDMDMAERLDHIDREYLSGYEHIDIDTKIGVQSPFEKTARYVKEYSVTEDEPLDENTYLSYNMVIDNVLDRELYIAFQILEYTLLSASGAVLKQALLDRGIGKDVLSTYENGIYQPFFSIIVKNSEPEKEEEFISTVREVLEDVVKNGLDKKALRAGINVYEFRYREADFGSYPKGLMYGLQALDSWLYDEEKPFIHIEENDTFAALRERIDTDYFEDLIKKYLIDNKHSSIVILKPERGLTAKKDAILADRLKKYKDSLSDEQIEELIRDTNELLRYQEEPSTKEELETIPLLEISDIKKEVLPFTNEVSYAGDTLLLTHDIFTNGIGYLTLSFDISSVPDRLVPYIGLFQNIFISVSTENFSYADLASEINQNCGGISSGVNCHINSEDPSDFKVVYDIRAKALYEKLPFVFGIISEMIRTSDYNDDKRLLEILNMVRSSQQMTFMSSGHAVAAMRAMSKFSVSAALVEKTNGIEFYRFLDDIIENFDTKKEELKKSLKEFAVCAFRPENLMVDYVAEKSQNDLLAQQTVKFMDDLFRDPVKKGNCSLSISPSNEGYKTSAKVQYVAVAGDYRKAGFEYTGALQVLRTIMSYDYLWINVRVKGGAYGCMNSYTRFGPMYFASYRDPNLNETLKIFKEAEKYISEYSPDERDMNKYIIGTISNMDIPLTPRAKGLRSMIAYVTKTTYEKLQKERDEVLGAKAEDIRKLAGLVGAAIKDPVICVLGGEETIEKEASLFDKVETLL